MIGKSVKRKKKYDVRRILGFFMLFNMLLMGVVPISVLAASSAKTDRVPSAEQLKLEVKSAVLLEPSTGQVLLSVNADEALPPASMTKMMTEYIVAEQVKQGKLSWDDTVTVRENAAKTIGSRIFLAEGDQHTVQELYIAMAVGSANDATVALAEHVAGSEEAFVKMMNDTAKKMGLKTAYFINSTGLSREDMPEPFRPEEDKETVMSAMDAAILAKNLIKDHPNFSEVTAIQSYKFRERDDKPIININWMLEANKNIPNFKPYAYEGLDGLKTGHTEAAKYCFTGTAERDGMRLISVVMGAESEGARFVETRKILDYGFNHFEVKELQPEGAAVKDFEYASVKKGKQKEVGLVTDRPLTFVVPKGTKDFPENNIQVEVKLDPAALTAPVAKDTKVGTVSYHYKVEGMSNVQTDTLNLVATEEIEKAGWFKQFWSVVGQFFSNLWDSIKNLF